jgi:putative Mg2+ transporter-C (MgtC) family protein
MSTFEILIRLLAATIAGGALGLNRDLHGKPTGVRTLGLVGLGSALAVMAASAIGGPGDATRAIQGILTGIGFLGAGVIVRPATGMRIHGLTTAACTWLTACLGIVCAIAEWRLLVIGLLLSFALLMWGGHFEKVMARYFNPPPDEPPASQE